MSSCFEWNETLFSSFFLCFFGSDPFHDFSFLAQVFPGKHDPQKPSLRIWNEGNKKVGVSSENSCLHRHRSFCIRTEVYNFMIYPPNWENTLFDRSYNYFLFWTFEFKMEHREVGWDCEHLKTMRVSNTFFFVSVIQKWTFQRETYVGPGRWWMIVALQYLEQ